MNLTELENIYKNYSDYGHNNYSFPFCEFFDANYTRQYITDINRPVVYILWILCVFGCVGNLLTIIVFRAYKTSTSTLLTVLAVSDTATLLMNAVIPPVFEPANYNTVFICHIFNMLVGLPFNISPWILVIITIERVVSVVKPFEVKTIFTVKKTRIYIALLVWIAFGYCSINLYGYEIVDDMCQYRSKFFEYIIQVIMPWPDVTINAILPGFIISIGNIIIITHLYKMSKRREQMTASKSFDRSITITLVTASCLFCIIMLPTTIYRILSIQFNTEMDPNKICSMFILLMDFAAVGPCLVQLNACLNFYIYVISGRVVRNDVLRMIKATSTVCKSL